MAVTPYKRSKRQSPVPPPYGSSSTQCAPADCETPEAQPTRERAAVGTGRYHYEGGCQVQALIWQDESTAVTSVDTWLDNAGQGAGASRLLTVGHRFTRVARADRPKACKLAFYVYVTEFSAQNLYNPKALVTASRCSKNARALLVLNKRVGFALSCYHST